MARYEQPRNRVHSRALAQSHPGSLASNTGPQKQMVGVPMLLMMFSLPGRPLGRHPVRSFLNELRKLPTGCRSGGRPGRLGVPGVIGTPILAYQKKTKNSGIADSDTWQ